MTPRKTYGCSGRHLADVRGGGRAGVERGGGKEGGTMKWHNLWLWIRAAARRGLTVSWTWRW